MADLKKLYEERGRLEKRMQELVNKADEEKREMSAEESQEFDKNYETDTQIRDQIERHKKLDEVSKSLSDARNGGFPPTSASGTPDGDKIEKPSAEDFRIALGAWCKRQYGIALTKRDKAACQRYQSVNKRFSPNSRNLDLPLFDTSQQRALQRHARGGHQSQLLTRDVGVSGAASFIPEGFVSNLELAMLHYGPMLQSSEVITTQSGNDLPWPTADDTGNTGALLSEATTIGDSVDPTMSAVTFGAYKFSSKLIKVSTEVIEDSAFDIADFLSGILGERLGRILNTYATTGSGNSQPHGIVTASTLGVTAALSSGIAADEILDLQHSVDVAYRTGAAWMAHDLTIKAMRKLKDQENRYLWQSGLQDGVPDRLLGGVVWTNNDMDAINDGGTDAGEKVLLYGQMNKYKIRRVRGIRMRRLVELYAGSDQEGFVAFLRADSDLLDAGVAPVKHLALNS